jgi:hypothetical protein
VLSTAVWRRFPAWVDQCSQGALKCRLLLLVTHPSSRRTNLPIPGQSCKRSVDPFSCLALRRCGPSTTSDPSSPRRSPGGNTTDPSPRSLATRFFPGDTQLHHREAAVGPGDRFRVCRDHAGAEFQAIQLSRAFRVEHRAVKPRQHGRPAQREPVRPETGRLPDVFHDNAAQLRMRTLAGINGTLPIRGGGAAESDQNEKQHAA